MNPEREPDALMEQHLSVLLFYTFDEGSFPGLILVVA
jgi:hypothetical protein